jgi:N-acetylglutamate synthase-like GNAT family acetyltransferase
MEILCRLAEAEDLSEILKLQSLSLRMLMPPSIEGETLEALIEQQKREREKADELIILTVCNHQILGFVAILPMRGQISGLFVHPDFVRQKIGSLLLTEATNILEMKHHRSIFVLSSEYAKSFYKYHGFRLVQSQSMLVDRHHKVRVFLMRKELRPVTPEEQQQQRIILGVLVMIMILSLWAAIS